MSSDNNRYGGCGCGAKGKGIAALGVMARTGHHARARSAGQAAPDSGAGGCGGGCGGSCGCGASGDGCGCGCGCNPGVFVQPNFFAGQLLTDDDLQALTTYVVTKQRMHNRFLVGSGVACGLAVTCHPCGGGRVIVQPGYAVDCCGNDILVPCAVELDINAMVRALRISLQGQDCGDPCAEPVKDRSPQSRSAPAAAGQPGTLPTPDDHPEETTTKRGRRYCLYLDYCEEPADLVSPYTQDDSCAVTCQPSRLREGFTFELRCPGDDPEPPSFVDRLQCCIGDLGEADRKAAEIERSQAYAQRSRLGVAAYKLQAPPPFEADDAALIIGANKPSGEAGGVITLTANLAATADKTGDTGAHQEQMLRKALDEVHALGAATARFHLLSDEDRAKALEDHGGLEAALVANQRALAQAAPTLVEQAGKFLVSPFERAMAQSIVAETRKYTDPELAPAERQTQQAYVYAYDGLATPAVDAQASEMLARFKAWLLRKIDECPPTGQCCLEAEVNAIQLPSGEEAPEAGYRALEKLSRAFIRYLLDCICAALLPPCPTCEDPAVKLACVQIDDCDVCEICNLERTFLLTEPNLRYWIPLLHAFGQGLERLCCDFADRFRVRAPRPSIRTDDLPAQHAALKRQTAFFQSGSQLGALAASSEVFPNLMRFTGLDGGDVRASLNISGNVARLTARDPVVTSMLARYTDADVAQRALGGVFGQHHPAAAGPAAETVRTQVERAAERVQRKMDARLKDVTQEIDKRLSPDALEQATVIRDLMQRLDEQREASEKLHKRIVALEKRRSP